MIPLTPAYGRDYKNKKDCLADLVAGKDFILNDITNRYDGKPCSIRDLKGQKVKVRYKGLREVFIYEGK